MEKLKIETGVKKFQIVDENDEPLGVIKINCTDFSLYDRADKAEKVIIEIVESSANMKTEDLTNEEMSKKLVEMDIEIKKQLDFMFNYNVSEVVFGNTNCLSYNNGVPFVIRFLNMIKPAIEECIVEEREKSRKRVEKYTKDYQK